LTADTPVGPSRFSLRHHVSVGDDGYELVDAGDGRRLERFGGLLVDRPAPTAEEARRDPVAWADPDLRFDKYLGWSGPTAGDERVPWIVEESDLRFELRATDTGQVGLFPEQATNRAWVGDAVSRLGGAARVLNLFAYTGAMTLASAAAGASVTHVDASRPAVAWARRNAELSGLADRPVRWIVDDVETFVAREQRRKRDYDAVIVDPPSYGHGRGAGAAGWRLEERLAGLLGRCADVTGDDPAFVILTAHTPGFGPDRLASELARAFGRFEHEVDAGELGIRARSGAHLRLGAYARIIRE
jgi:23S rRNA (cytosine1962-C5)-methyltransferase